MVQNRNGCVCCVRDSTGQHCVKDSIDRNGLSVLKTLDAKCSVMYCFRFEMFSFVAGYSSLLGVTGSDWRVSRVEVGVSGVPLIVGNTLTGVALVVNGTGDVSCVSFVVDIRQGNVCGKIWVAKHPFLLK